MMKTFALTTPDDDFLADAAWAAQSRGESDFCSKEGAAALKAKIEAYWRERGQDVVLSLHNVGFHPAIRAARFDVRSNMVNGMPRGLTNAGAQPMPSAENRQPEFFDDDAFECNELATV
jgi:hypothetical protein